MKECRRRGESVTGIPAIQRLPARRSQLHLPYGAATV